LGLWRWAVPARPHRSGWLRCLPAARMFKALDAAQLPAGRVVQATAEGRAAGGKHALCVAEAGLAKGTRVRQTATLGEVLAYFSGVGVLQRRGSECRGSGA
jgi:hypothetical protein